MPQGAPSNLPFHRERKQTRKSTEILLPISAEGGICHTAGRRQLAEGSKQFCPLHYVGLKTLRKVNLVRCDSTFLKNICTSGHSSVNSLYNRSLTIQISFEGFVIRGRKIVALHVACTKQHQTIAERQNISHFSDRYYQIGLVPRMIHLCPTMMGRAAERCPYGQISQSRRGGTHAI